MKKLLSGLALMLLGGLSCMTLLAGAMQTVPAGDGYIPSVWMALDRYHLLPLFWIMAAVGIAGAILAVTARLEKK